MAWLKSPTAFSHMMRRIGIDADNRRGTSWGPTFLLATPPLVAGVFLLPVHWLFKLAGVALVTLCSVYAAVHTARQLRHRIAEAEMHREYAREMEARSRVDPVTGLSNRVGFEHDLACMMEDLPLGTKLTVMWIDLHRFIETNNSLGHAVGDRVLQEAAERLRANVPDGAAISRFSSDEFVVAAKLASAVKAQEIASALRDALAQPYRVKGHRIESGSMIGVAAMPDDAITQSGLLQAADLALYHAKASGPNEVRFFHDSMTRALARKKEIEAELRAAIQRDELSIFFQPIFDLRTGRIRCFEALVRWFHPEKGELYPDEFIPVAEDTGLIITLGNWITRQAAKAATSWPEHVTLAVNLSPVQIKAPGAALGILAAVRDAGLAPSRLELELTENLFLEDDENTAAFIDMLSAEGIHFSLDDFGTGYSSLSYINRHPFRTIKVDRSFVSGVNAATCSEAIIRAVAEMGRTLDMEIVAEGLETIDQVHSVRAAGCTLGQGYYFSRAVPDFTAAMLLAQEQSRLDRVQSSVVHPIGPEPMHKKAG
ncbi:putative bifunctional diguanylate cyclase/phosphodiesterase [Aurantiacibacter sp. MUD61]|uniref:putative bifunctional diguanylate cyclase/phosphodiesterase n=1 Tax=Aurantiacibacter sp. MUD61 TaxID=3009083 RepID=UPI0022F0001C|nr:EAL domain-containing protein [Aurantiacibacter sp. MUD61]